MAKPSRTAVSLGIAVLVAPRPRWRNPESLWLRPRNCKLTLRARLFGRSGKGFAECGAGRTAGRLVVVLATRSTRTIACAAKNSAARPLCFATLRQRHASTSGREPARVQESREGLIRKGGRAAGSIRPKEPASSSCLYRTGNDLTPKTILPPKRREPVLLADRRKKASFIGWHSQANFGIASADNAVVSVRA